MAEQAWLAPTDLIVYPDDNQMAAVLVRGSATPEVMHWWSSASVWQRANGDCVRMGNVAEFFPLPPPKRSRRGG